jgi:hypothetical protein
MFLLLTLVSVQQVSADGWGQLNANWGIWGQMHPGDIFDPEEIYIDADDTNFVIHGYWDYVDPELKEKRVHLGVKMYINGDELKLKRCEEPFPNSQYKFFPGTAIFVGTPWEQPRTKPFVKYTNFYKIFEPGYFTAGEPYTLRVEWYMEKEMVLDYQTDVIVS